MAKKGASKRVTLQQKYKIEKRVKEHKRKLKKAQKANAGSATWISKQEANIPNDWPFKDQMLVAIEKQRELDKAAEEKNKAQRKAAAEKKKKDAAENKKPVESMLPRGMAGPIAPSASQTNAHILDAYTKRVWREIKQVVEESDIVLEVLDARDPLGSRCFEVEEWAHGKLQNKVERAAAKSKDAAPLSKPLVLVLNKADLVPVHVTQAWLEFFAENDIFPTIAFHSNKELEKAEKKGQIVSPKDICAGGEALLQLIANFQASADEAADAANTPRKPLKVGIIGYGNVGKSSVLNTLARTHASGVGAIAGYTKELMRYKLGKGLYAIDTPGVPVKEEAPGPHITLPINNAGIVSDVERFTDHFEMENLMAVLNLPVVESIEQLMDALASRVGRQMKGGEYNHVVAARKLFKDWNEGRLPFYTKPPQVDAKEDQPETSPIQSFFVAANKKTVAALKKRTDATPEAAYLAVDGSLFDEGEDDEDAEDEDADMEGDEDMEDAEEDEDEEMEEEEEVVVPPPSKKKGKAAAAAAPAPAPVAAAASTKKAKAAAAAVAAAAPAPVAPASSTKKGKAAAAAAAVAAPVAAAAPVSAKKGKQAAAAPAPTPATAASPTRSSRKRAARDEEEDADVVVPAPKKQAAAPKKDSAKPTPKAAPAAAAAAPASASKKGKGKK